MSCPLPHPLLDPRALFRVHYHSDKSVLRVSTSLNRVTINITSASVPLQPPRKLLAVGVSVNDSVINICKWAFRAYKLFSYAVSFQGHITCL